MQKRSLLIATLLLLLSFAAEAQNGTIKGFVYDKKTGEPMIYTNVLFEGKKMGVQTDVNGYFSISLPAGSYDLRMMPSARSSSFFASASRPQVRKRRA